MPTDVQSQIAELEARILQLRSGQLGELKANLAAARKTVTDLESQIAAITGGKVLSEKPARQARTSSEDVRGRILKVLAAAPQGLSQKEISSMTELNYNTVILFLNRNIKEFKTTGKLRSKRYFLK